MTPLGSPVVFAIHEGDSKDYDFSRASMEDHWRAGYYDAVRTLRHPETLGYQPIDLAA